MWQIRYYQGKPTSEPYQVRQAAKKTRSGSYRTYPEREAAIIALWGSVQHFIDSAPLVCITRQDKT